jgi:hypothetical protein
MMDRDRGPVPGSAGRGDPGRAVGVAGRPLTTCGCADTSRDNIDAIMETVRRSMVQIIREVERQHGVARCYDVLIVRKST